MAEITHAGMWVRWSSLTRRDKRDFALSMALLFISGFLLGGMMAARRIFPLETLDTATILLALTPMPPLVAGVWLYSRFVVRQDELFQLFHQVTSLWTGTGLALATILAVILQEILQLDVFGPREILISGVVASIIGGLVANRKYL